MVGLVLEKGSSSQSDNISYLRTFRFFAQLENPTGFFCANGCELKPQPTACQRKTPPIMLYEIETI